MLRLEAKIQLAEIVHTGPELIHVYAQLRADCEARGHALAQRAHTADRWIAATAIRLGVPLVSNDHSFATYRTSPSSHSPADRGRRPGANDGAPSRVLVLAREGGTRREIAGELVAQATAVFAHCVTGTFAGRRRRATPRSSHG